MTPSDPHLHHALGHAASDKRLDILRRIGEVGSISQAARDAGVSYKAAWQAVETLSNLAGCALLSKAVGGSGGGGARLTTAGRALLALAERWQVAREQMPPSGPGTALSAQALSLRTSMRNTLPGRVRRLRRAGAAVDVHLSLPDEQNLVARITRESAQLLALRPGMSVLALCKATAVAVHAEHAEAAQAPGLRGTVSRAPQASRAGEVSLRLGGDVHVVGFVDAGHGLRKHQVARAHIDPAAVVIGLS
jgi:molybdate transport system regulatory protein